MANDSSRRRLSGHVYFYGSGWTNLDWMVQTVEVWNDNAFEMTQEMRETVDRRLRLLTQDMVNRVEWDASEFVDSNDPQIASIRETRNVATGAMLDVLDEMQFNFDNMIGVVPYATTEIVVQLFIDLVEIFENCPEFPEVLPWAGRGNGSGSGRGGGGGGFGGGGGSRDDGGFGGSGDGGFGGGGFGFGDGGFGYGGGGKGTSVFPGVGRGGGGTFRR